MMVQMAKRETSMSEPWNSPSREISPEQAALHSRRRWLQLAAGGLGVTAGAGALWWMLRPGSDDEVLAPEQVEAPGANLYPAKRSARFDDAGRPWTIESAAARYSNFYEFTSTKAVWRYIDR